MAVKKTPMRKCAGCDEMKDKKQLVRVVHTPEGEFMLDFTGKKSGRGGEGRTEAKPEAAEGGGKEKRPERNAERPADKVGECRRPTERREGEKKSPVPSAERKPAEGGEGEKSARRRHHRGGRGRRGGRGGSGGGAPGAAPSAE